MIISTDKIPAFLQALKHVISMFTTAQSGIWVGLQVTSLRESGLITQETFTEIQMQLNIFGLFVIHFLSKLDKIFKWKSCII